MRMGTRPAVMRVRTRSVVMDRNLLPDRKCLRTRLMSLCLHNSQHERVLTLP